MLKASKFFLTITIASIILLFPKCICDKIFCNPCTPPEPDPKTVKMDVYIEITNQTNSDNLKLYYVKKENIDSCSELIQFATLDRKESFKSYHVVAGETNTIYYCTPTDKFCTGCNKTTVRGFKDQQNSIFLK